MLIDFTHHQLLGIARPMSKWQHYHLFVIVADLVNLIEARLISIRNVNEDIAVKAQGKAGKCVFNEGRFINIIWVFYSKKPNRLLSYPS